MKIRSLQRQAGLIRFSYRGSSFPASSGGGQSDPNAARVPIWAINGGSGTGNTYESPTSLASARIQHIASPAKRILVRDGGGPLVLTNSNNQPSGAGFWMNWNGGVVQNAPGETPRVHFNGGASPFWVQADNARVRGIHFEDISSDGSGGMKVSGGAQNFLAQYCTFKDMMSRQSGDNVGCVALSATDEAQVLDPTFEYCIFDGAWDLGGRGTTTSLNSTCVFAYNTDGLHCYRSIMRNSRSGVYFKAGASPNWLFEENFFEDILWGIKISESNSSSQFLRNLFLVNGFWIHSADKNGNIGAHQYKRNTVVGRGGPGIPVVGLLSIHAGSSNGFDWDANPGAAFQDNLISPGVNHPGHVECHDSGTGGSGRLPQFASVFDFQFYDTAKRSLSLVEEFGAISTTLPHWKANNSRGYDQMAQVGSVPFVNEGGDDLRILSGAALNAAHDGGEVGCFGSDSGHNHWKSEVDTTAGTAGAYTEVV